MTMTTRTLYHNLLLVCICFLSFFIIESYLHSVQCKMQLIPQPVNCVQSTTGPIFLGLVTKLQRASATGSQFLTGQICLVLVIKNVTSFCNRHPIYYHHFSQKQKIKSELL